MKTKNLVKKCLPVLLFVVVAIGLYFFCNIQTHGFRPYLILSNLPNDPRWEVAPLSAAEQEQINQKLNQSFTFLGSGGWCFAFLGEDQTTVLKFYRHSHLALNFPFKDVSLEKLRFMSAPWPVGASYAQELNFVSCSLLYKEVKERTGLLYVHLNKTEGLHPPVTLFDAIGVKHTIDLDSTEFIVQDKVDLILPHFDLLMKKGEVDKAKRCVKDTITCFLELYEKGIWDTDTSLKKNYGFIGDKAVALDLSSFIFDPSLKNARDYTQKIRRKTRRLERYLKKHHPILYLHYQECIDQLPTKETL